MSNFEVLFEVKVYSLHSQVGLFDADAKDAYPQWKTGNENIVFGPRGAVVATATDQSIEVFVCQGKGSPEHVLCVSGEILLGDHGFIIGNVASEHVIQGIGQSGRNAIVIYTNGIGTTVTKIHFFVEYLKQA